MSVGLAAFLYNIPRFMEVTWDSSFLNESSNENVTEVCVVSTALRNDPIYIRYLELGVCRVGNCSSHEPPESLAVESGRVEQFWDLDFRANRVKNKLFRVKIRAREIFFFLSKIE